MIVYRPRNMMKIKNTKLWILILLLSVFVLGIFVCLHPMVNRENLMNMMENEVTLEQVQNTSCPNLLIRSGKELHLVNTNRPKGPDNPVIFPDLDAYLNYLRAQRSKNIRCPVLFLQEEQNAQGETVYRMRPSPLNMNGDAPVEPIQILDASRDTPPYNENQYSGFDAHGQHIGELTQLDEIHASTAYAKVSDNPMDTNWGGTLFSQDAVASGKYEDRQVGKPRLVPKVIEIYK
jgi:hypothetical protein